MLFGICIFIYNSLSHVRLVWIVHIRLLIRLCVVFAGVICLPNHTQTKFYWTSWNLLCRGPCWPYLSQNKKYYKENVWLNNACIQSNVVCILWQLVGSSLKNVIAAQGNSCGLFRVEKNLLHFLNQPASWLYFAHLGWL